MIFILNLDTHPLSGASHYVIIYREYMAVSTFSADPPRINTCGKRVNDAVKVL
jgi:hypothetical protein